MDALAFACNDTESQGDGPLCLIATKDCVTMLQSWSAVPSDQVSLSGGAGR